MVINFMLESVTGTILFNYSKYLVEDPEYLLIRFAYYRMGTDSDSTGCSSKELVGFSGCRMMDWIIGKILK